VDQYELSSQQVALENNQTSKTAYTYGAGAQLTEQDDYDYGNGSPGSLLRQAKMTYQSFTSPIGGTIFDRPSQVITYDGSANRMAETDYTYDGGTTVCGTAGTPSVQDVSNLPAGTHDETHYSASSTGSRGNVTQKIQWLNTGTSPLTTYAYDKTGQVLSVKDPCGNASCSDMTGSAHTTNYSYANSYTILSGSTNVPYTPSANTNAFITQITDPLTHTANFTYDFNGGDLTVSKDANSQSDLYLYNDAFARPTQMNYPDGGQTSFSYNDSTYNQANNTPNVQSTKAIASGLNLTSTTAMDGSGHAVRALLTSDPAGNDTTDTTYDGLARVRTQSNPYRSGSSSTDGTATHNYDVLGRVTSVVAQDGSTATTSYSGNCTTVTDETGKARRSCVDGLARLTGLWEDPSGLNYETDYAYDALDNLTCAVQKGTDKTAFTNCASAPATWRPRSFVYDSLSQLTSAVNPESGTILYAYDADGNVITKTAPLPNQSSGTVSTSYRYDVLNRLSGKSYVGLSTPAVSYFYDQTSYNGLTISNGVGRRTGMIDGSGATAWNYDSRGRIAALRKMINGIANTATYTYPPYVNGEVADLTYFSGTHIAYTWSGADLPLTAIDPYPINFVKGATYSPAGALAGAVFGAYNTGFAGTTVSNSYNNRLQPVVLSASSPTMTVFSLSYNFNQGTQGAPKNNGSVVTIQNNRDNNRTQAFTYDALNRIASAQTPNSSLWGDTYVIDAWGNLTNKNQISGKGGENLQTSALTNNQLTGMTYDVAGNVINDGVGHAYVYDAEDRLISAGGMSYIYDGDGNRVEKCTAGSTAGTCASGATGTLYWRGKDSETINESDLAASIWKRFVYFNGKIVARRDSDTQKIYFFYSDHLGSMGVVTDQLGQTIQNESDYYPYGGERVITSSLSDEHYKFTGKERDAESGLDNFGARYNASTMGRFMTPDWAAKPTTVPYAEFGDPQSLNLYSYVRNNPLSRRDADGHEVDLTGTDKDKLEEQKRITANASKKGESRLFKTVTDKNGKTKLVVDKEAAANFKGQHSAGYNLLTGAINAKPTITVEMSDMDSETKAPDSKGNVTVNLDRKESAIDQISPLRGYDGKKISNPFQIIAGHEVLGHAYPAIMGWDSSETNARAVENELRGEQGLPLRDPSSN
jgi:RHS repeat-associated protein